MQYVYAGMWFIIGALLVFRLRKENKVFLLAGIFFFVMGAWWLANAILSVDLFSGIYGWIFRGIAAVVLVVLCVVYVRKYREETVER